MTDHDDLDDIDAVLCPGTWPQLIGHHHVCARTIGHRGDCECLCGATAASELMTPTTAEETP